MDDLRFIMKKVVAMTLKLRHLAAMLLGSFGLAVAAAPAAAQTLSYTLPGTGQDRCFGATVQIACPPPGAPFAGADGAPPLRPMAYHANGDGTVTDLITGLTWAETPSAPVTLEEAERLATDSRLGGHGDWPVPSIRELYSLMDFRGGFTGDPATSRPYINTSVFRFAYGGGVGLGDASAGRRSIDAQEWTATRYQGRTVGGSETVFGVNFADGRIKGYPLMDPANRMRTPNRLAVRLVRGPPYGINDFRATAETVLDAATGLEWQRADDGVARSWQAGLSHCAALRLGGHADWRLPDAKELHSIVDYGRIPAIDPVFRLVDPTAYVWASTTHLESPPPEGQPRPFTVVGELAVYFAFGAALGRMEVPPGSGTWRWVDAHGAGAQRSDPKTAQPGKWPQGFGPQGDDIRGHNHVRCVRRAV
ncbi:MAG: DUF1566 domain-containing protein [Betaproteobacteria bacterium]